MTLSHSHNCVKLYGLIGYPTLEKKKKVCNRETRGKTFAFVKTMKNALGQDCQLVAAAHNCKVPMLLVATASTLLPAKPRVKSWKATTPEGAVYIVTRSTDQAEVFAAHMSAQDRSESALCYSECTQMHATYHEIYHVVDDHNELRQGEACMADAWQTKDWAERHFAEGIGLWEVNVYKAAVYFQGLRINHNEFRKRLAHAFLTLGKATYGDPISVPSDSTTSGAAGPSNSSKLCEHRVKTVSSIKGTRSEKHPCGYCAHEAGWVCIDCFPRLSEISYCICGPDTGRTCLQKHAQGVVGLCKLPRGVKPPKEEPRYDMRESEEAAEAKRQKRERSAAGGQKTQAARKQKARTEGSD